MGVVTDTVAQSTDRNYIKTTTYLDASGSTSNALKTVQYFDGLGRPVQTVQQNVGPSSNNQDLISVQEYDAFGRESKAWLPVPRTTNTGAYYTGTIANDAKTNYSNDTCANSLPVYESSPLNRIEKQFGPGQAWRTGSGHPVKTEYLANTATYPCRYYSVSSDDKLVKNATDYANGSLYVTKLTDEDGKVSYEFKDKLGRVVLQRQMDGTISHDTYYVYDDFSNLRFVLPPTASDSLSATTTYIPASNSALKNYAYIYKYDSRNRCTEKKLPGAEPILYVYDKADRLIFSQDGEQRTDSSWIFCKYDALNRIILTGVWKKSGKIQSNLVSQYQNTLATEQNGSGAYGYTWTTLAWVPSTAVLQANYYDNWDNLLNTLADTTKAKVNYGALSGYDARYVNSACSACSSKGLLVGTRAKMLDDTSKEIVTAFYYDAKGRVVQQKSTNLLGGSEAEYYAYSFTGNPVKKQIVHTATGKSTITEVYTYAYDHANRPTTTKYKLDSNAEITLSELVYDNLGRLKEKKLHGAKETIAYTYNIRNWLRSINSANLKENIYYTETYANSVPLYNGNISVSELFWKMYSENTALYRAYMYTYDGLNRMTKGVQYTNGTQQNCYNEELVYDKQGNIVELTRNAPVSSGSSTYNSEHLYLRYIGNQLNATSKIAGAFNLFSKNSYNKNGALTIDPNRKISDIRYNVLNLPDKITFSAGHSTLSGYDATGVKRRMEHITVENTTVVVPFPPTDPITYPGGTYISQTALSSTTNTAPTSTSSSSSITNTTVSGTMPTTVVDQTVTDYCGSVVYEKGNLKYILTPEGYISKNGSTVIYNYYLKDHLGNNRVVTAVNGSTYSVIQKTDYYPFGKPYPDSEYPERQPYKFGGKEYDEMHGANQYDFVARQLDAMIPRFTTMDPLAEKYYSISPYAYCLNNPLRFVDRDGRDPGDIFKTVRATAKDWGNYYNGASILRKHEFGSTIYEVRKDGKLVGYSYSVANEGKAHGVDTSSPPNAETVVADIHSHGNDDIDYDDNNFSDADKADNDKKHINGYLASPNGSLQEYNTSTTKTAIVSTDLPSDPKDPDRKNKIEPTDVPAEQQRVKEQEKRDRILTLPKTSTGRIN